jgi:hypothetical protein
VLAEAFPPHFPIPECIRNRYSFGSVLLLTVTSENSRKSCETSKPPIETAKKTKRETTLQNSRPRRLILLLPDNLCLCLER